MPKFGEILVKTTLLNKLANTEQDFEDVLLSLNAQFKRYSKNGIVILAGDILDFVAIVLKGILYSTSTDIAGNRIILHQLTPGDSFGASVALLTDKTCPLTVTAMTDATVFFIPMTRILETGLDSSNKYSKQIIRNVLELVSKENVSLHIKNDLLSQKTTRAKLLLYFANERVKAGGKKEFEIQFNRDELADYLCVNRSAMCREIGKMRDEGLLEFHKNSFILKK